MAPPPPALDDATLWRICEILAATDDGLTNTELDRLLAQARVADPTPRTAGPGTVVMVSKRERLHRALSARQGADGHAAGVLHFVKLAMQPARYTASPQRFEDRRHELNVALSFAALRLEEDGRLVRVRAASTLTDTRRRAQRLRQTLADRHAHSRLLAGCVDEVHDENYFHAVLEATKSLAEEIRRRTGLTTDGVPLAEVDRKAVGSAGAQRREHAGGEVVDVPACPQQVRGADRTLIRPARRRRRMGTSRRCQFVRTVDEPQPQHDRAARPPALLEV